MKNNTFLLVVFFWTTLSFAQAEKAMLYGNIKSQGAELENIHILNRTSKKGAITDSNGNFIIEAKVKDTILITGVQFYSLKVPITKQIMIDKTLEVDLMQKMNELEEVEVKHGLTGNITVDSDEIKVKKNIEDGVLNFSEIDFNLLSTKSDDASRSRTSSDSQLLPNMNANLLAIAGFILKPIVNEVVKIGATKRKIKKYERNYSNKVIKAAKNIRADFGDTFFTETLKIPTNHIDEFIATCLPKGIANLYVDNKRIEIIDILLVESKIYLEGIKNEN